MKKVAIGMSGGVDSAVAGYLLKKEGYDVIAIFMRNWDSLVNNEKNGLVLDDVCPQEKDYNDAKKVCEKLNIPLYRVDFVKEYWDYVFTYFLDELKNGRTPNPDMLCNKYIKFDFFVEEAKKLGADYIATGHYARLENGKLLKSIDLNKDQTYFLADVSKNQLENVLFPIGKLLKSEVRKIAEEQDLPVFDKKDSTGICFIGERNFQKFIENYLKPNPGDIISLNDNKKIGTHTGLMNYTIGQRKNVGLSGNESRYYVCGKDVKNNILYVSYDEKYLESDACLIEKVNLLTDNLKDECTAKFRYRGELVDVKITKCDNDNILVSYASAKSVTPGQACVLYDGDICLGCGFIKEIYKNKEKIWYINS